MTPHFSPALRSLLLQMPIYTPALLGLEGEGLSLVLRVDKLASFRKPLPIKVNLVTWRSDGGTWIVAVAFRVTDNPKDPLEGDAYLNPRQQDDWNNLVSLSKQTRFPFVFCNSHLTEAVGKAVPWTEQQRQEVQALIDAIDPTLASKLSGSFDPDFQRGKEEFQRLYSVSDLLSR